MRVRLLTAVAAMLLVCVPARAQFRLYGLNLNQPNFDDATQWPATAMSLTRLWDTGVTWRDIEKTAGIYDFSELDQQIRTAQAHGIGEVIYAAGKVPPFYGGGGNGAAPPSGTTQFRAFVTALASHVRSAFPDLVVDFEQWNEPNLTTYFTGTAAQLVALNRAAYAVLHPMGIRVLSPSGSGGTAIGNFILSYLTACAGDFPFDVFAYHAYLGDGQRTPNAGLAKLLEDIKVKKQSFGIASMPTWFTEGSWGPATAYTPALSAAEQATYLTTMYAMDAAAGVQVFVWYAWNNTHGYGVLATGIPPVANEAGQAFMALARPHAPSGLRLN